MAVERVGDAPPRPLPAGDQPLSGLRSLQFTQLFAGTAAGRVLAEQGADVLHVCEPNAFDHDLCWNETGVGLRSARLALGADGDAAAPSTNCCAPRTSSCTTTAPPRWPGSD